jgi:hypothetical protein
LFNRPRKALSVLAFCSLLFILGVGWLFWLRFQAGDLYPPYSSLRGDPLGTQVLFESVQGMAQGDVRRHFRSLDHLTVPADTTFLVVGVSARDRFLKADAWPGLLERISAEGGRLVVTFIPTQTALRAAPTSLIDEADEADPDHVDAVIQEDETVDAPPEKVAEEQAACCWSHLLDHLGLALERATAGELDDFAVRDGAASLALPIRIPWRAPQFFSLHEPEWEVVYRWQERPVVVQRSWGRGSVVMATDSYLLSNEALREHRMPTLLAWWLQLPNALIVDEFHLGLVKQPGISSLLRKYRLQGVVATLLLLVILMMWRQASALVPESTAAADDTNPTAIGQRADDGWIALMQHHIPIGELVAVCHGAWRNSAAIHLVSDEKVVQVASLLGGTGAGTRRKDPVALYHQICQLLRQGIHL